MNQPITVLVIEDNRLLRDGIVNLLGAHADIRVVGAVESADKGLPLVEQTRPRVVLVDAGLGEHDSLQLVERIRETEADSRVVVMDFLATQEDVVEFVGAGASGFVLKQSTVADLLAAIRAVAEGETVIPTDLGGALLSRIAASAGRAVHAHASISELERQVVTLIADGLGNQEIARRLKIPVAAVRSHAGNVLEKLALYARSPDGPGPAADAP
jgi:DNA-binding NarL/FixJ family response regulator